MQDFSPLLKHISSKVDLTDKEQTEFVSAFKEVKVKKRQFIVQPNFIAKHRTYVVEGAFRAYVVNDKGQEITIQFAIEDWWISDFGSFILQEPATMFVIALKDSVILQLDYEEEQKLKRSNHTFETFFRINAERAAVFLQDRIIINLIYSAKERYEIFIEKYPIIGVCKMNCVRI
jgi:CRP-like cAMP-binding protein